MKDNKSIISKNNNLTISNVGEVLQITKDLVSNTDTLFAKNWINTSNLTFDNNNLSRWIIGSTNNLIVLVERSNGFRIKLGEEQLHSALILVSIDNSSYNISRKELNHTYIDCGLCQNSHIFIIEEPDCFKEDFSLKTFDLTGQRISHLKNTYHKYNYDYSEINYIYSHGDYLLLAVYYENKQTDEYNFYIHLFSLKDLSFVRSLNVKEIDIGQRFCYDRCEFISDYLFSCQVDIAGFDGVILKQSILTGKYILIEIGKDEQILNLNIVSFEHILIYTSSSIFVLNGITEKFYLKRSFKEEIIAITISSCKKYIVLAFKNKLVKVLNSVTLLEISEFYHDCEDYNISSIKIINQSICIGGSKSLKFYQ